MLQCVRRRTQTHRRPFGLAVQITSLHLRKQVDTSAFSVACARADPYLPVTNLESVVLQLQESCREAKTEAAELRKENSRLRHGGRERDKFFHAMLASRGKPNGRSDSHPEDFPPHLQTNYSPSNGGPLPSPIASSHVNQYGDQAMANRYQTPRDPSGSMSNNASFNSGHEYSNRSPTLTFAGPEADHGSIDGRPNSMHSQRMPNNKYGPYSPYEVDGNVRDHVWAQNMAQAPMPGGDAMQQDGSSSSHSPSFVEPSSNLTSPEMSYVPRYPVEDQKMSLTSLDTTAPYVFSHSRPLSPSASTTSSASSTMTSPFPFQFTDNSVPQDRPDYNNFRRHSTTGAGAELTLHGGTAHISLMGDDRYRLPAVRRPNNGADSQSFAPVPSLSAENPSHERNDAEADASYYHGSQAPVRRSATTSRTSRSPSPGTPPICGTLAVIKAQAFGALRRTRTRTKKGSEGAAKAAMEALEARGIGMGMSAPKSNKRPRLDDDDDDDEDFHP